jgi:hypothetical protein
LPPHRLELRNKQVRERQRERQRDGETLTSWEISTPPLMNSFPLRPNTCTRTVFSAIPIPEIFLKSLLLQTTTKLTNPVHE